MRFSASKSLGHGIRVGVSQNVAGSRRTPARRPPSPRSASTQAAALSQAGQAHATLAAQADVMHHRRLEIEQLLTTADEKTRPTLLQLHATAAAADVQAAAAVVANRARLDEFIAGTSPRRFPKMPTRLKLWYVAFIALFVIGVLLPPVLLVAVPVGVYVVIALIRWLRKARRADHQPPAAV